MKRLPFYTPLLAALLLITASSCEKKYCWKCDMLTITRSTPINGIDEPITTDTVAHAFSECDKTASEIKAYEHNSTSDQTEGNLIVNTLTTTTCNQ